MPNTLARYLWLCFLCMKMNSLFTFYVRKHTVNCCACTAKYTWFISFTRISCGLMMTRWRGKARFFLLHIYRKKMVPNARKLWLHQSHCTVQRTTQREISVFPLQTPWSYTVSRTHLHREGRRRRKRIYFKKIFSIVVVVVVFLEQTHHTNVDTWDT